MALRTQHPFHMYDAITAQPQAYADTIERIRPQAEKVAPRLAQAQRLFLVGIGTSSHAAQVGYHLFRHYGVPRAGVNPAPAVIPTIQVWHSFDFALYGPPLTADDAVIMVSHRGAKHYGLAAIQRAKEAGCYTLLITGQGEPDSMQYADEVLKTTIQDPSSAHTISYSGSQAALACLAEALAAYQSGNKLYPATFLHVEVPDIT